MSKQTQRFAPIPLRACRDLRLSALHHRTLEAICAFDRLGRNGQGCWVAQNRIAEIVHCSKSHLSNILSDLRDWGYIRSKINPDKRWFRVHNGIYTEEDFNCLEMGKSVPSPMNCLEKSVHQTAEISSPGEVNQFTGPPKKNGEINDIKNITIVPTITRTIEEAGKVSVGGQDCAEARRPRKGLTAKEAETYLANCEAIAASDDRDSLKHERKAIERIADDAVLPEEVNGRAVKLLAQIPSP